MNGKSGHFLEKLKTFLHDPIEKCFDIKTHEERAKKYAENLGISGLEDAKGSDQIASCMERSLLPKEKTYQEFNEIRHPLSDESLKFTFSVNKDDIFNSIEDVFSKLNLSSYDDEKKFFYLWRNLEDEIYNHLKDKEEHKDWLKYLSILPADTRIPDHSIWEHLKVSSAVKAFWDEESKVLYQNNSLFLFTIGPVQSFISQARKTQDFYMGSFILSYLTFAAMKEVINFFGPTSIIYPDLYKQPFFDWFMENELELQIDKSYSSFVDLPTIPNRFVAIIPLTEEHELKNLANEMKNKIKEEINFAKKKILKDLKLNLTEKQISIFENHLADFPQIYWVAVPWKLKDKDLTIDDLREYFEDKEIEKWKKIWNFAQTIGKNSPNIGFLYQLIYSALEKSLGARKNLRKFIQFEEKGRKCSLCGEKNVIFFREEENPQKFLEFNPEAIYVKNTKDFPKKYLADGEGLCGLCFLKRTFEIYLKSLNGKVGEKFKYFGFPSTAEIAVSDFKEMALEKAKEEFNEYQKILIKKGFPEGYSLPKLRDKLDKTLDGEWLFEENLRREFIKKELGLDISDKEIKELKGRLKSLVEKVGNRPNPYYAIIYLDGDNMGKWLSGELLPEIQYAYNSETWKNLPDEFKKGLKEIISKKILTPAIHSAISRALRNYAIEFVRKIVEEEHLGKLIYAGGDDVLAFVNLKDLLDVMEKLRWAFSGHIKFENGDIKIDLTNDKTNDNGFVEKDGLYLLTMGKNATASMGIVIAHYKEPLKIVIDKVFEMEKRAKNEGKNRFAISLIKKSGEERTSVFEWLSKSDENNILLTITDIMKNIKEMMDEDAQRYISHRFIQKFKIEFMKLKDEAGNFISHEQSAKTELKRLINRAYNGNKDKKREFCDNFFDNVWKLFLASGMNINNFVNIIEILAFMNKGD